MLDKQTSEKQNSLKFVILIRLSVIVSSLIKMVVNFLVGHNTVWYINKLKLS